MYDFTWRDQTQPLSPQQPAQLVGADSEAVQALPDSDRQGTCDRYPIAALPHNIPRAVSALRQGQVVALPTDTLYGLAADANSSVGIRHIYSIKRRQAQTPLAICIAEIADLQRYCVTDHLSQQLLEQLLPGKVTLILQRRPGAPLCPELNPGLPSIGRLLHDAIAGHKHHCTIIFVVVL